jgi:SAM-dependent methyltransferase
MTNSRWFKEGYAEHFFRWSFAKRFITVRARVLDLGCGIDPTLPQLLASHLGNTPRAYVGVDKKTPPNPVNRKWAHYYECPKIASTKLANVVKLVTEDHGPFDVVVAFDIAESLAQAPKTRARLLRTIKACLAPSGIVIVSTAPHQLNFKTELEIAGFEIENRFGVLATDTSPIPPALRDLRQYYDDDVLASLCAPLYPESARFVTWVARDASGEAALDANIEPIKKKKSPPKKKKAPRAPSTRGPSAQQFTADLVRQKYGDRIKLTTAEKELVLAARAKAFPAMNPKVSDVGFVLNKMRKGEI